jgi:hypothetical protein
VGGNQRSAERKASGARPSAGRLRRWSGHVGSNGQQQKEEELVLSERSEALSVLPERSTFEGGSHDPAGAGGLLSVLSAYGR